MKQEKKIFYRTAKIPYGYKMKEDNSNYCIDEPAAAIIKIIFNMFYEGQSLNAIQRYMSVNIVSPPKQYEKTRRVNQSESDEKKIWSLSTIRRILGNPVYIGTIVRHKSEQCLYDGIIEAIPESDWTILENNHKPIIERKIFEHVQKRLKKSMKRWVSVRKNERQLKRCVIHEQNIFHNKIFCGECKAAMIRISEDWSTKTGKVVHKGYVCGMHRAISERCCAKFIEEKLLCDIIYAAVQKQLSFITQATQLIDNNVNGSFEGQLEKNNRRRPRLRIN